MFKIFVAVDKH